MSECGATACRGDVLELCDRSAGGTGGLTHWSLKQGSPEQRDGQHPAQRG